MTEVDYESVVLVLTVAVGSLFLLNLLVTLYLACSKWNISDKSSKLSQKRIPSSISDGFYGDRPEKSSVHYPSLFCHYQDF